MRRARRPPGWSPPGPLPAGPGDRPDLWPADGEDLCFLTGDFRIFQRVDGHRWSVDDLVTAWRAAQDCDRPAPGRVLDLGCGIGSVLMMLAWRLEDAELVGVEAQTISASLARRSIAYNGLESRVRVELGDLRERSPLPSDPRFDLVTGTPPYFEPSRGVVSDRPQKGPCRFELRGGVEAYCAAARAHLHPGGRFTVCEDARQQARVEAAMASCGLRIDDRLDVIGRTGKPPLFSVFRAHLGAEASPNTYPTERLVVRTRDGRWTPTFARLRAEMGLPTPSIAVARE